MIMAQSSPALPRLPAFLLGTSLAFCVASAAAAQSRYRVVRDDSFRQEAGPLGKELATVSKGVEVTGAAPSNGWVEVSVEGWVWNASVGRTARDGHNLIVTSSRGENL